MNNFHEPLKKVLSVQTLVQRLKKRRAAKVVFTNGCFDLIHSGHVALLQKAKSLGDILVVGLNSDGSVKKLKGNGRPILSEKERAKILSAFSCVDYVTIFSEETPAKIIRKIKPQILVKGGDYALSKIVGRKDAKKVVRFPLVKNFSTSQLIEKIVKTYGKRKNRS